LVLATAKKYAQFDDDLLVKRSLDGDGSARSELVARFLPRIWRIAYLNAGATEDVEDLVQTAMLTALESLSSYRGPDRFKYWLDRVTINVIRSHFRKNKLRRLFSSTVEPDKLEAASHHNEERQVAVQRLFGRLAMHLSKIKEKNRVALVLSVIHGYQAREIADITGCSVEAAWKRTKRGYDDLLSRLKKDSRLDESLRELVDD
jgi:RNA polymerase sigma-70 factor (ECF subfamily)